MVDCADESVGGRGGRGVSICIGCTVVCGKGTLVETELTPKQNFKINNQKLKIKNQKSKNQRSNQ